MARVRDNDVAQQGTAVSPPPAESTATEEAIYDGRNTTVLAGAHFAHDLYPAMIGVLIPAVQAKLGIPLALASLMVPAQQMPSILQPFIGVMADRTSRRWFVVLSPATAAISLSMVGLAPHVAVVILLLLVSGVSSAAFHAPAVALVGEYGGNKMGRAMSIFMAGGELSRTIGPLLLTAAIALFTLEGSVMVMVFGIAASVLLYLTIDTARSDARRHAAPKLNIRPILRARRRPIGAIFGYVIINAVATTPFHFFLVRLLVDKGHSEWYGGIALSVLFGAGVIGGLIGGGLSDTLGRRTTLAVVAAATAPLMYLYLILENGTWPILGVLAIAGMVSMAGRPVTLALTQELLPEARGPMAGMMLAVGFVSMSIAAIGFGALGDAITVERAFLWSAWISLLGLPFIALLPRHGEALATPK